MSQNSKDGVTVVEIESKLDSEMETENMQKKGRGKQKKVDSSLTKINDVFKPQTIRRVRPKETQGYLQAR